MLALVSSLAPDQAHNTSEGALLIALAFMFDLKFSVHFVGALAKNNFR